VPGVLKGTRGQGFTTKGATARIFCWGHGILGPKWGGLLKARMKTRKTYRTYKTYMPLCYFGNRTLDYKVGKSDSQVGEPKVKAGSKGDFRNDLPAIEYEGSLVAG
jgi:hypothetical protein